MTSSASPKGFTSTQWLICVIASIGFLFDTYELLMTPLVAVPAIAEFLQVPANNPLVTQWTGKMLWITALCGGVFGLLGGWLIDRFGRKRIMAASIFLYALSPFAAAFSTSLGTFIFFRCTTFIGVCVEFVAAITWLAGRFLPRSQLDLITEPGETVVVAGLGPVGNTVVQALRSQGLPLLLIDRNEHLLSPWSGDQGIRCHQGRIEDMEDWLPILGHRPALVVLTYPIVDASALVATRLRDLDPDLVIVARAPYESQIEVLERAGVRHVICDERETARALLPLLLAALDTGDQNRMRVTRRTLRELAARQEADIDKEKFHP